MAIFSGISFKSAAALVALVILAGAAAYYYYEYLPETESTPAKQVQVPAKPPISAKPPVTQSPATASAVPAVSAVSAPLATQAQPAPAQPVKTVQEQKAAAAIPEPAVLKPAPKKTKPKPRPVKSNKVSKPSLPVKSQQIIPPVSMVVPAPVEATTEPKIVTPKYNDMLTASLRGDIDGVKQLLELGRWVDKPGPSGMTPLEAGVMNHDIQMVKFLLEHGAEPSSQALKLARKNKDSAIVRLLEQHIKH